MTFLSTFTEVGLVIRQQTFHSQTFTFCLRHLNCNHNNWKICTFSPLIHFTIFFPQQKNLSNFQLHASPQNPICDMAILIFDHFIFRTHVKAPWFTGKKA